MIGAMYMPSKFDGMIEVNGKTVFHLASSIYAEIEQEAGKITYLICNYVRLESYTITNESGYKQTTWALVPCNRLGETLHPTVRMGGGLSILQRPELKSLWEIAEAVYEDGFYTDEV